MQKMLTPHVRAIGRPAGPAQDDAVDPARVEGTPAALTSDLIQLIGKDQVLHRISNLVRYASDASPYRYLPQVVVLPRTVDDVRAILAYCARTRRHATFRAGGTSLNGQSQSDDILIDVRRHWAGLVVEDGGARLRARPGTILGHANAVLRRAGRRLGPDPASADVATIGGVIANNAGGMRCTLERNAYHTVSSLTLVLASGTVIDTAAPGAEAAFAAAEPELAAGLLQLRSELLADEQLAQRVRHKFAIRNTNGYALSALLDADTPLEIFRRLIVGSEGTLAFMAEAVINTIPAPANTTVSWIVLPSISEAAALVSGLVASGAEAVELMLAPALAAAAQAFPGTPGAGTARCRWSSTRPHARTGCWTTSRTTSTTTHRARLEQITLLDSIAWCDRLLPALTVTRARRARRRPPDLLHRPPGADQDPRAPGRPPRRRGPRAGRDDLLRHRR